MWGDCVHCATERESIHERTPYSPNVKAAAALTIAFSETIRESGRVVSGHLYAAMMAKGVDMRTFEALVGIVTRAGLVRKDGDELVWIGRHLAPASGGRQ